MEITDNAEVQLIQKFRDIMSKGPRPDRVAISREFGIPSQLDSDDMIHVSVSVRCSSREARLSSEAARVDRAAIPEKYRSPCST